MSDEVQQMTSGHSVADHPSDEIARLAFSMFLYVADVEKNISVQEVRRFQNLMNELEWVRSPDLRGGLSTLKDNYSALWEEYEDGALTVNILSVAAGIDRICRGLGTERGAKLRQDLLQFLQRLDRGGYGAKLLQADARARAQARDQLSGLLRLHRTRSADAADSPERSSSVSAGEAPLKPSGSAGRPTEAPEPVEAALPAVPDRSALNWEAAAWSPTAAPVWAPGKTRVRCVEVLRETHDTKTYCFVSDPISLFHFKPGQFITIEVPVGSTVLRRSYTISSSPSRPYVLSITVKKVPMGWLSNWLFDNVEEGFECTIAGPAGKFTCFDHPAEKMLFLTAGSGVTPAISMLRWLSDTSSKADVVFINNVRSPDDIIFHHEILHLGARLGNKAHLMIVPSTVPAGRHWHGPTGRLNEALLRICAPDFAEREAFVCGPGPYMESAKNLLQSLGHPSHRYHDESFGPAGAASSRKGDQAASASPKASPAKGSQPVAGIVAAPSPGRDDTPALDPSLFLLTKSGLQARPAESMKEREGTTSGRNVTIKGSGQSFAVEPGQTILEAAEAAGVPMESSCRSGTCGSCKMRKISGEVKVDESAALSQEDIEPGHVLTCISSPVSDVVLAE